MCFDLQGLIEDIDTHRPVCTELEQILLRVDESPESETEKKQMKSELNDVIVRFCRVDKLSQACAKHVEEVEPIAKELDENLQLVEALNYEVNAVLSERSTVVVDLRSITTEIEEVMVSSIKALRRQGVKTIVAPPHFVIS